MRNRSVKRTLVYHIHQDLLPPYPPRDVDGNVIPKPAPPLPDPLPYSPLPQTAPTILGSYTTPTAKEPGLPSGSSAPPVYVPTQQQLDSGIEPNPSNPWGSAAPVAPGPMEHRQFAPDPSDAANAAEPEVSLQEADANELKKERMEGS